MKGMKRVAALVIAASMVLGSAFTSMAASWQQNATGWWWQNDDGTWPANEWRWLDGNNDGVAECYYFDSNGYMAANTTTPDGYQVNTDGAWVVNGAVQTQTTQPAQTTNADVMTGYNSDGLSNAAIDILNHTRSENTKYGVVKESVSAADVLVYYSNGLRALYLNDAGAEYNSGIATGYPEYVRSNVPTDLFEGVNNSIDSADEAERNLEANGFSNTYNNGVVATTTFENYQTQWTPIKPIVQISKIN